MHRLRNHFPVLRPNGSQTRTLSAHEEFEEIGHLKEMMRVQGALRSHYERAANAAQTSRKQEAKSNSSLEPATLLVSPLAGVAQRQQQQHEVGRSRRATSHLKLFVLPARLRCCKRRFSSWERYAKQAVAAAAGASPPQKEKRHLSQNGYAFNVTIFKCAGRRFMSI